MLLAHYLHLMQQEGETFSPAVFHAFGRKAAARAVRLAAPATG